MIAVIHYSEIALKGKNRSFFENKLVNNIITSLKKNNIIFESVSKEESRILCYFNDEKINVEKALKCVFGIKYFAFVEQVKSEVDEIINKSIELIKDKKSISLITKRADKKFPINSLELNIKIGEQANKLGIKINFKNAEQKLFIEILSKNTYLYTEKILGIGGLPVGSSGKVLVLLSGGIDSNLAAWLLMKRGCNVDFLHFHTFPQNKIVLTTKIKKIVETLNSYQIKSRLYLVPYHNYQILTEGKIDQRLDLVVFKNFILRTAQELALKEDHKAIVTGDSLGQVASQTLQNIASTSNQVSILILRPLIGFDKDEIIEMTKKIGTYEESIKDYKDCCSIVAKKPLTSVSVEKIQKALSQIDMNEVIQKTISEIEVFEIE